MSMVYISGGMVWWGCRGGYADAVAAVKKTVRRVRVNCCTGYYVLTWRSYLAVKYLFSSG